MSSLAKIIFFSLGGALIALLILVAALPSLLSTSYGTSLIEERINKEIPGRITLKNIDLSWFSGQKLTGITLSGKDKNQILSLGDLELDNSLFDLISNGFTPRELTLNNLSVNLAADATHATNLEEALGIKEKGATLTEVSLDDVNIKLTFDSLDNVLVLGRGNTHQGDISGKFYIEGSTKESSKLHLKLERFPVLILDQLLSLKNKDLGGTLIALVGESLDVNFDKKGELLDGKIKSQNIESNIQGSYNGELKLDPGSKINFSVPVIAMDALLQKQGLPITLSSPFTGSLSLDFCEVPLTSFEFERVTCNAKLQLEPNTIKLENSSQTISLNSFLAEGTLKGTSDVITLSFKGEGKDNNEQVHLDLQIELSKKAALSADIFKIINQGIALKGIMTHGTDDSIGINGVIRDRSTAINLALEMNDIHLPTIRLDIVDLPLEELFSNNLTSDIEGSLTLLNPEFPLFTDAEIDHITIPWVIDPESDSIKISFKSSLTNAFAGDNILGTLRLKDWKKFDLANAPIQIDLHLKGVHAEALKKMLPDKELSAVIGKNFDAEFSALKDVTGNIQGTLGLENHKSSDSFLTSLSTEFSIKNDRKDITFKASTVQKIGSTDFSGTLHNITDNQGNLKFDISSFTVNGKLKHFPISILTMIATGDKKTASQVEALIGASADAEIHAEISSYNGPLKLTLQGINGQLNLNGRVERGNLLLNSKLTASVKVTPQLEQVILSQYIPILTSVISAESPITIEISENGFSIPLRNPSLENLTIESGFLSIGKVKIKKDSEIGNVVSLIGVNQDPFDVWFTPLYFSLQNGIFNLQRSDMLIGQRYPLATWGKVNFNTQKLKLIIAITGKALANALNIKAIPDSYVLQVPVKGTLSSPSLETAKVAAKIASLAAISTATPQGVIIGTLVDTASSINEEPTPKPTTNPLPWADSVPDTIEQQKSNLEKLKDLPVDEIKHGAKKLLKGLLGK